MKLSILFIQRKCRYDGEYAPEAIAIADEFTMSDNPDYMEQQVQTASQMDEVESFAVIEVMVSTKAVEAALNPKQIEGKIV